MEDVMTSDKLVFRLNRAVGQVESIKKKIENNDDDCMQVLQQLKASINALKKFGEAYMSEHLEACLQKGMSTEEMKTNMKSVISGAFSL
jgi:CsoR family transcriptional regulator, copper-sensing transcriptional repressor